MDIRTQPELFLSTADSSSSKEKRKQERTERVQAEHPYLDPLGPDEQGASESRIRRLLNREYEVRVQQLSRRDPTERSIAINHPLRAGIKASSIAGEPLGARPVHASHRSEQTRYQRDVNYERMMGNQVEVVIPAALVPTPPPDPTCSQLPKEVLRLAYEDSLIHNIYWSYPTLDETLDAIARVPDTEYGPLDTVSISFIY